MRRPGRHLVPSANRSLAEADRKSRRVASCWIEQKLGTHEPVLIGNDLRLRCQALGDARNAGEVQPADPGVADRQAGDQRLAGREELAHITQWKCGGAGGDLRCGGSEVRVAQINGAQFRHARNPRRPYISQICMVS